MEDIISKRLYNRESKEYGQYKVISYLGERGKTKVPYYKVKFKDTGNIIESPLQTILEDRVVDIQYKKKQTKKKQRKKKKFFKQQKKDEVKNVYIKGETRLLSLDVSSKCTGYSIFINGELEKYGYIYQSSDKRVTERLNGMKVGINNLIQQYDINVVCVEDVINLHKRALVVLSKAQGILLDMLFEENIKVGVIPVAYWKSKLDVNQNSDYKGKNSREQSKLKTLEIINKRYNLSLEKEFAWDNKDDLSEPVYFDVSDSLAIATVFLENNLTNG